jgi:lysophospholipid acyltransferase (LPLAT)-like uncharacterized protein
VLSRTWDQYRVVLPFARVCIVFGPCIEPGLAQRDPGVIARAIDEALTCARATLGTQNDKRLSRLS